MNETTPATVAHILLADAVNVGLGEARLKPTAVTPGQLESTLVTWTAPEGGTEAGIWEATPGTFTATRVGYHEVCQILTGRATVVNESGESNELRAGDLFVTPVGWKGVWHVHEQMRKTYMVVNAP
ncbi:cupin domain-containing protein [Leifsonia sp. YAF41]|uniref:cupin domain-containing protein n=1 Tax=Leifsonia sp. YAF41 TaxID=3233086 RepID=UPI003F95F0D0